jgi:hypothetical protein
LRRGLSSTAGLLNADERGPAMRAWNTLDRLELKWL